MTETEKRYQPEYPILKRTDCREDIELVPEEKLSPLESAELARLREGKVVYNCIAADTPKNRENIAIRTTYYQMVAFKERWTFDPQKYQVRFVDPDCSLLSREGEQARIYCYKDEEENEGRIGFVLNKGLAKRIEDGEAWSWSERILRRFFCGR